MGKPLIFVATMASGNSVATFPDLSGSFFQMTLEIPSGVTGFGAAGSTPFYIQGSGDGTNWRRYAANNANTSTSGTNDYIIASGTSNRMVPLPQITTEFLRIEASAVVTTATLVFKLHCQSTGNA